MEFPKDFSSTQKPAADQVLQGDVPGPAFHSPQANNRPNEEGDNDKDVEGAGPNDDKDDTENQPEKEVIATPENEPA